MKLINVLVLSLLLSSTAAANAQGSSKLAPAVTSVNDAAGRFADTYVIRTYPAIVDPTVTQPIRPPSAIERSQMGEPIGDFLTPEGKLINNTR